MIIPLRWMGEALRDFFEEDITDKLIDEFELFLIKDIYDWLRGNARYFAELKAEEKLEINSPEAKTLDKKPVEELL